MSAAPASRAARDRLLAAQQAESRALKDVEAATNAWARASNRLLEADTVLVRAQAAVVKTSGLDRAAFLLDVDRAELRRRLRDAERAVREEGQGAVERPIR